MEDENTSENKTQTLIQTERLAIPTTGADDCERKEVDNVCLPARLSRNHAGTKMVNPTKAGYNSPTKIERPPL